MHDADITKLVKMLTKEVVTLSPFLKLSDLSILTFLLQPEEEAVLLMKARESERGEGLIFPLSEIREPSCQRQSKFLMGHIHLPDIEFDSWCLKYLTVHK